VLTGGSIIFFTYIGFDSVSTAAEECKNPQRDLPIGIIATLIVCTVLYVAVAVCLTGWCRGSRWWDDAAPVVNALKKLSLLPGGHPLHWVRLIVLFGALMGMISSLLVYQLGQSRVWFRCRATAAAEDLQQGASEAFGRRRFRPGWRGFWWRFLRGSSILGLLADLSNIGTLFAFVLVSIGVIVLRYREPERRRGFRVPAGR
jgi:APA family basic amino acid/polyamine antiporter